MGKFLSEWDAASQEDKAAAIQTKRSLDGIAAWDAQQMEDEARRNQMRRK